MPAVVGTFQHFEHFAFGRFTFAAGVVGYADAVVVHGVGRIAFGDEDGVAPVVGDERVLAVAFADETAGHLHAALVQAVDVMPGLGDVVVFFHFGQQVHAEHLQRVRGQTQLFEDAFQGHVLVAFPVEIVGQQGGELLLGHSLACLLFAFFFLFTHGVWRLMMMQSKQISVVFRSFPGEKMRFPVP